MYKSFAREDFQKVFGIPEGYEVSGILATGTYDVEKQLDRLGKSLAKTGMPFQIDKQIGFLRNIYEIRVNKKIYWFTIVYGGTMLSEYVHVGCLFGSQKNISIGSCGGLYPEMESTDYLIPTWSYGDESSTRFYDRENIENKHFPDKNLGEKIKSKLNGEKVWEGPVMTCQAMLGETKDDVEQWSKDGYYGVEMETSTVFAVSKHFKVPATALIYVTDNLIKGQVVGDESHNMQKEARQQKAQKMFDVAVEVLLEI